MWSGDTLRSPRPFKGVHAVKNILIIIVNFYLPFSILILSWVSSGIFQRLHDMWYCNRLNAEAGLRIHLSSIQPYIKKISKNVKKKKTQKTLKVTYCSHDTSPQLLQHASLKNKTPVHIHVLVTYCCVTNYPETRQQETSMSQLTASVSGMTSGWAGCPPHHKIMAPNQTYNRFLAWSRRQAHKNNPGVPKAYYRCLLRPGSNQGHKLHLVIVMDWMYPPQNSYIEILIPNVMVLGGGAFGRWLSYEDEALTMRLVPL